MTIQATFILCDDLAISLTGKFNAAGVYTGDLIAQGRFSQLACLFIIEGDVNNIPKFLSVEVKLPGELPVRSDQYAVDFGPVPRDRTRWTYRIPFLIGSHSLRPGQIEARVIYDQGELPVSAPWIIAPTPAPPPI
jgi:hypothetical protein